jgi:hypothetical protein
MKKWVKKIYVVTFLLSFNSKLSHFDKNLNLDLNLNQKWLLPTEIVFTMAKPVDIQS